MCRAPSFSEGPHGIGLGAGPSATKRPVRDVGAAQRAAQWIVWLLPGGDHDGVGLDQRLLSIGLADPDPPCRR